MNFFLAHCDICTTIQSPHFGFGKKRCFDEFFFKSCCCCVQEVLPQPCYSSLHYVGRSPKLLLTETITANPFSISWAFKLAHEMPCVLLLPLSTSVGSNQDGLTLGVSPWAFQSLFICLHFRCPIKVAVWQQPILKY